jgi:hypothetical protein
MSSIMTPGKIYMVSASGGGRSIGVCAVRSKDGRWCRDGKTFGRIAVSKSRRGEDTAFWLMLGPIAFVLTVVRLHPHEAVPPQSDPIPASFARSKHMKFYHFPSAYSAQIRAAGLSLNFRNRIVGVAPDNWRERSCRVPRVSLDMFAHTGQSDQVWIFRLTLGRSHIGWRTWGERKPQTCGRYDRGGLVLHGWRRSPIA